MTFAAAAALSSFSSSSPPPSSSSPRHPYRAIAITIITAIATVATATAVTGLATTLANEIRDYESNWRFQHKIREMKGEVDLDGRLVGVLELFENHKILRRDMNVLDLGAAAGSMLKEVSAALTKLGGHGDLIGVELVPGWVKAGNTALEGVRIVEGDSTDVDLDAALGPGPHVFDLVMLNDVLEHIMVQRRACLFETISKYTRPGESHSPPRIATPEPEQ